MSTIIVPKSMLTVRMFFNLHFWVNDKGQAISFLEVRKQWQEVCQCREERSWQGRRGDQEADRQQGTGADSPEPFNNNNNSNNN